MSVDGYGTGRSGAKSQGEGSLRLMGWPAVIAVSVFLVVLLAGAALLLRSVVGGLDLVGVCADLGRQVRVSDQVCGSGQPGAGWVYYRVDKIAPGVGQSSAAGIPSNSTGGDGGREVQGGVPVEGGPVTFPPDR